MNKNSFRIYIELSFAIIDGTTIKIRSKYLEVMHYVNYLFSKKLCIFFKIQNKIAWKKN